MSPANSNNFIFYFVFCMSFIVYSLLIMLAKIFNMRLGKKDERKYYFHVPYLRGLTFNILSLKAMLIGHILM